VAVPNLLGDSVSQAADDLSAAQLTLGSVGFQVDNLCNFVNQVMRQSPGAGTLVPVGSRVSVTIGTLPSHACP
jgi:beta-lactam-binding protein with PASTA domain